MGQPETMAAESATVVRELSGEDAAITELLANEPAPETCGSARPLVLFVIRVPALTRRLALVIARVKRATRRQRIILLLDRCTHDGALSCFAAGADEVLINPVSDVLLGLSIMAQTRSLSELAEIESRNEMLERKVARLEGLAYQDPVTTLPNRRAFEQALRRESARHQRLQQSLAIVMCDIDHFKNYNDTYGHQAGDIALRRVAMALGHAMRRETDVVFRYGGEEFIAVLSNTDADGAARVATAMCSAVAHLKMPHRSSVTAPCVTVSCGVAALIPTSSGAVPDTIKTADQALYAAKRQGGNRVSAPPAQPPITSVTVAPMPSARAI